MPGRRLGGIRAERSRPRRPPTPRQWWTRPAPGASTPTTSGRPRRPRRSAGAIINGTVFFQDYCATHNFASGGFIADSQVSGTLFWLGNQQYIVRNSSIGGASGCPNGLWNMVYSGVQGAPTPVFTGQCQQNTVLAASPVSEEQPFLCTDASAAYHVFVPSVQANSSGTSWASGTEAGKSLSQTAGVRFHDVFGLWIKGSGGLDSVINGAGGPATDTTDASNAPVDEVSYP